MRIRLAGDVPDFSKLLFPCRIASHVLLTLLMMGLIPVLLFFSFPAATHEHIQDGRSLGP